MNLTKEAVFFSVCRLCKGLLIVPIVLFWFGAAADAAPGIFQILPPANYPNNVDLGIKGIYLYFRKSTEEVLGKSITFTPLPDKTSILDCYNVDHSEVMRLTHQAGAQVNSVQEFAVESAASKEPKPNECTFKDVKSFETYRGVRLGMSISEVTAIYGDDFKALSSEGVITVRYGIESNVNSTFMSRYKRQRYYGTYIFQTGKLIKFSFGFDRRF